MVLAGFDDRGTSSLARTIEGPVPGHTYELGFAISSDYDNPVDPAYTLRDKQLHIFKRLELLSHQRLHLPLMDRIQAVQACVDRGREPGLNPIPLK